MVRYSLSSLLFFPYEINHARVRNNMKYGEAIALRCNGICREKGITLNKLATLSGLRQSTLDNIAKGNTKNPSLRTLHRIATGLNMTVAEFLDFDVMNSTIFEDE
jgi:transcriptional regulator with XRE-family HTH domain